MIVTEGGIDRGKRRREGGTGENVFSISQNTAALTAVL